MPARPDAAHLVADRYELLELIGRGGAGEVWRAIDHALDREVAVKRLAISPADDHTPTLSTHARARREARAAARLRHPGAVTLFDIVDDAHAVLLVMEYVDAPDLATLIGRDGALSPREVAVLGLDLLETLRAAHAMGIVHRDVKPANVLVPEGGRPRLTDFGTAVLAGDDRLTATGLMIGSPAYMAPEQALTGDVDHRADLWSLGATLYHAVEGVPPFAAGTPLATANAVTSQPHRPMVHAGPLEGLLDRLLRKDPAARPSPEEVERSLWEVAEGIPADEAAGRAAVAGQRTAVLPVDAPEAAAPPRRTDQTSRRWTLLAVVALLALAAVAFLSWRGGDDGAGEVVDGQDPATVPDAVAPPVVVPTPEPVPTATVATPPPPTGDGQLAGDDVAGGAPADEGDEPGQAADQAEDGEDGEDGDDGDDGDAEEGRPEEAAQGQGRPEGQDGPQGQGPDGEGPPGAGGRPGGEEQTGPRAEFGDGTVPEGWVTFAPDDAPYVVAHPPGWERRRLDGTRTDIADPSSGTYLRLDWTDAPAADPLADWQRYEQTFASSHAGYERIRLEETTFKGSPAAIWEYAYDTSRGRVHAYNLNGTNGEYGYALNFQASDARWEEQRPLFDAFAASYEIAGG